MESAKIFSQRLERLESTRLDLLFALLLHFKAALFGRSCKPSSSVVQLSQCINFVEKKTLAVLPSVPCIFFCAELRESLLIFSSAQLVTEIHLDEFR